MPSETLLRPDRHPRLAHLLVRWDRPLGLPLFCACSLGILSRSGGGPSGQSSDIEGRAGLIASVLVQWDLCIFMPTNPGLSRRPTKTVNWTEPPQAAGIGPALYVMSWSERPQIYLGDGVASAVGRMRSAGFGFLRAGRVGAVARLDLARAWTLLILPGASMQTGP